MLADYLSEVTQRRWQPGTLDCCTFMADWLIRLGYPDPMADRRGSYASKREYQRMLACESGIVPSCTKRFALIGLRETCEPNVGDIALVMAPVVVGNGYVFGTVGAICLSNVKRAVVTPDRGLVIADMPTLRAWNVDNCKFGGR